MWRVGDTHEYSNGQQARVHWVDPVEPRFAVLLYVDENLYYPVSGFMNGDVWDWVIITPNEEGLTEAQNALAYLTSSR